MIKNNQELYESLSNLIRDLKNDPWAIKFKDAMEISSVPGEILGQIRVELTAFLKGNKNSVFLGRAKVLKEYLDMIL
jgi:hypothetical protein